MANITPRIDVAFKKLFGVEENKDLLISLINSIVSDEDKVADLTLMNPYNVQNFKSDKLSILDIKAKGCKGQYFNIEIQITDAANYDKRALYYWAKLYTNQLKTAEDYSLLTKTIGIHILNFISIPDSKKYHNVFHLQEKESDLVYFQDLELHTIELKKFSSNPREEFSELVTKIRSSLDMWVAFLTRHEVLNADGLPQTFEAPAVKKALHVLDHMNFGEAEREAYEEHLKWLRMQSFALKSTHADGLKEGLKEGLKKGLEKGVKEGRETERQEIARNMLAQRLDISLISSVTGLSVEQIQKLSSCEE